MSQNSRNHRNQGFSYYFYFMVEGMTQKNESGSATMLITIIYAKFFTKNVLCVCYELIRCMDQQCGKDDKVLDFFFSLFFYS
jgi:hypothetical protein